MRPLAPALALTLALLVAGCVAPGAKLAPASTASSAGSPLRAFVHDAPVALPADVASLTASVLNVGQSGGEPTIGVTKDGSLFVTGGDAKVWRSSDHGRSWSDASPVFPRGDLDPYLWVDARTDRVFSAPDNVACSALAWSDDRGATWTPSPAAGCGLPGHDHQSLVTGPPPKGVATSGYPDVVYYSYNSFRSLPVGGQDGTWVDESMDGGMTWSLGTQVLPADACEDGLNGAPAVAPDGTVFVSMPRCDGMHVGVSKDAGRTWKVVAIKDVGTLGSDDPQGPGLAGNSPPYSPNPGMGVDAAGDAFVAFAGHDGRMYLSRSTDEGVSWSKPLAVSPPDLTGTAYSALVAGDAGRVAIAYLGTNDSTKDWKGHAAQWASPDTRWHLYLTLVTDALGDAPTVASLRVTPADDPVQVGCIWQGGGENACRNLGDFLGMTTSRDGRAFVVYSDGCDKCSTDADSRRDDLKVAVEATGPSLLGSALLSPYGSL